MHVWGSCKCAYKVYVHSIMSKQFIVHYMYMQVSYYNDKCEVICQWQKIHTHICSLGKKTISTC